MKEDNLTMHVNENMKVNRTVNIHLMCLILKSGIQKCSVMITAKSSPLDINYKGRDKLYLE